MLNLLFYNIKGDSYQFRNHQKSAHVNGALVSLRKLASKYVILGKIKVEVLYEKFLLENWTGYAVLKITKMMYRHD